MSPISTNEMPEKIGPYRIQQLLGHGISGCVWLALNENDRLVAIKCLYNHIQQPVSTDEVVMMSSYAPHPNVIVLLHTFHLSNQLHLVLHYVGKDNLLSYVNREGRFPEMFAQKLAKSILNGLQHLHSNGIVHRDLKCENILLSDNMNPVICDLGFAARWSPRILLKEYCGSIHYSAPEILTNQPYIGPEIDIWSFGVVVYAIVGGILPWDGSREEILRYAIEGDYWELEFFSPDLLEFLDHVLESNSRKRWTINEIKESSWFKHELTLPNIITTPPESTDVEANLQASQMSILSDLRSSTSSVCSKTPSRLAASGRFSKRNLFSTKKTIPEDKLLMSPRFHDPPPQQHLPVIKSPLAEQLPKKKTTFNPTLLREERLDRRMTADSTTLKLMFDQPEDSGEDSAEKDKDGPEEGGLETLLEVSLENLDVIPTASKKGGGKKKIQEWFKRIALRKKNTQTTRENRQSFCGNELETPSPTDKVKVLAASRINTS